MLIRNDQKWLSISAYYYIGPLNIVSESDQKLFVQNVKKYFLNFFV